MLLPYTGQTYYGPGAGASVTAGAGSSIISIEAYARAGHVGGGVGSMPKALATRLVNSPMVTSGVATTVMGPMRGRARASSVIKVNELSQGDVTGAVLEAEIEPGLSLRQALRLVAAATAGKVLGGGTSTITFRNAVADGANRIVATVDNDGNRTAITYDLE